MPRYHSPFLYSGLAIWYGQLMLSVLAYARPVAGFHDIGVQFLPPSTDGKISALSPLRIFLVAALSTGRPVARSILSAQLTLTYGLAASSLPLARSST